MFVTLYQFGSLWGVRDPSPFCLKLEMYFKLADIDYESPKFDVGAFKRAPKGQLPFVQFDNGGLMGDSNLIIDHLISGGAFDPDESLSTEQKAISRAFRCMLDEHLSWVLMYSRWKDPAGWNVLKKLFVRKVPSLFRGYVQRYQQKRVWRRAKIQGMGRHSHNEIYQIGEAHINALSDYLGENKFCFDTERPALLDITLYAFMANILNVPIDTPLKDAVQSKANLVAHCEVIEDLLLRS